MIGRSDQPKDSLNFYGSQYARFASPSAVALRREVYGEDIGQQGWRSARDTADIIGFLRAGPGRHVLDVASGSGGPSLALVERAGCRLTGLDVEAAGIDYATSQAATRGLSDRATFHLADCAGTLPFPDDSFDGVLCIDAITHFPDREGTLAEWTRLLRPGGRLAFTDPVVITGAVAKHEIDARATIGFYLFVPLGLNESLLARVGLALVHQDDRTQEMGRIAARWRAARASRRAELIADEGEENFERRQRYYATLSELAESRRLSRFLYLAEKPG